MEDGCDISFWQTNTPLGYAFVFVRATYSADPDARWPMHRDNVLGAGRVLGAYAFGTVHASAAEQAATFIREVGRSTRLVALDMEPEGHVIGGRKVYDEMSDADGAEFIRIVKRQGYLCGLYHSESAFPELGQDFDWVAHWGVAEPTRHHLFHQYRGAPLDLDHFDGTLDQLQMMATFGGDDVGLDIRWLVTADEDPYDALGTAALGPNPITFWKVEDGTTRLVAALTDLAVVQRGVTGKALNANYPAGTEVVGTSIDGDTWVTPQSAVIYRPLTKPDCAAAVKAATDPLKAVIEAQQTTIAGEAARTREAIAADRAKAHVGIVYEEG